jgi:DNA adenine methylase
MEQFLASIQGKANKYKRVSDTPLRYAGGKSLAVGYIAEHLPSNLTKLVSPFFGGGSFEIALAKRAGVRVEGYDIFELLVNYWQVQTKQPDILADVLSTLNPDKDTYKAIKDYLSDVFWNNLRYSSVTAAAYYFFNHNLSYGPSFLGWPSSVYLNRARYDKMLNKVRNFSAPIDVKCASFDDVISNSDKDFIYADPPYHLSGKMFKGIYPQRNFPIHHNGFDHEKLRDLLHNHKGGFVLSYNDTPIIREWYSDFEIYEPKWQYTMGQGETRIGQNRKGLTHVKQSHELLIVKKGMK